MSPMCFHLAEPVPPRPALSLRGHRLTMANIQGSWRPFGTVAGAGVFAVVWSTHKGTFWAPLHDFEPGDQLHLIESCRRLDRIAGYSGAWPDGRYE